MKRILMLTLAIGSMALTGCAKLPAGAMCAAGFNCASGNCTDGVCVGKPNGSACTLASECADRQCSATTHTCVPQTCTPKCLGEEVCADGVHCVMYAARENGQTCYGQDEWCLSFKCDERTKTCVARSDGAYCIQDGHCALGHKCVNGACQADLTCNASPCGVAKVCSAGSCNSVLLGLKDACIQDSDCSTGFCDQVMNGTCQVRPGGCTPSCPSVASVTCGQAINQSDNCGGTCIGTGTFCNTGTCNGSTCVTPPTVDGATLYANNCASCHGALASSSKRNRSATQIQTAITNGTGGMGTTALRALTSTEVQAIANVLASDFSVAGPASVSIVQGTSGSLSVTASTTDNTSKVVTWSVSGLPTGVTASFNPASVTVQSSTASSTLTFVVTNAVAAANYTVSVTGTNGTNNRSFSLTLTITSTGGTGKANGASCVASTECTSNNCGPVWSTNKTCNGVVDIDQTPPSASQYDCHSGMFIAGTTKCAPDQFRMCLGLSGVGVQFWSGTGASDVRTTGTDKCVTSDPTKSERSATENGDLSGNCRQHTFWTASGGVSCKWNVNAYQAIWNTGRVYAAAVALMSKVMSADDFNNYVDELESSEEFHRYMMLRGLENEKAYADPSFDPQTQKNPFAGLEK